jgi:hypothetical protein
MKNLRTGVRASPIAVGTHFETGVYRDGDGFAAFWHPFSWLVWAGDQPNRRTAADARAGFSERHREFDHTGTRAVLVHLPIRLAGKILTLATPRQRVQLALRVIF